MEAIEEKDDEIEIKSSVLFNQKNDNISYNDDDDEDDYQFKREEDILSFKDDD